MFAGGISDSPMTTLADNAAAQEAEKPVMLIEQEMSPERLNPAADAAANRLEDGIENDSAPDQQPEGFC